MFTFIDPFKIFLRTTVNHYYPGCTKMYKLQFCQTIVQRYLCKVYFFESNGIKQRNRSEFATILLKLFIAKIINFKKDMSHDKLLFPS